MNRDLHFQLSRVQTDATLIHVTWSASVCTSYGMFYVVAWLMGVVAQSFKPVILLSQQLPKFLMFRDSRSET